MPRVSAPSPEIVVELPDPSDVADDEVRAWIAGLLDALPAAVPKVRVQLVRHADQRVARPVVATALLDVDGRPLRAEAAARTGREVLDGIRRRLPAALGRRMQRGAGSWEARRALSAAVHDGRHSADQPHRPPYAVPADGERAVIARAGVAVAPCGIDDAVADMADMDYRFHLFTELGSQQDSLLYVSPSGLRLQQVLPQRESLAPHGASVLVSPHEAPALDLASAVQRLKSCERPFVLYLDEASGRGAVLYHRFDGHYGLLTPAGS